MRWVTAPLVAAFLLTGAGFVDSLARTTDVSAAMTASTSDVPRTTRTSAAEAAEVPVIARLTGQQAASFADLVKALRATGERVAALERALADQVEGTTRLRRGVVRLLPPVACSRSLLDRLVRASQPIPQLLKDVGASIGDLNASQRKSLKHLRSINRKLRALGAAADARGIEAARPPGSVDIPRSRDDRARRIGCATGT